MKSIASITKGKEVNARMEKINAPYYSGFFLFGYFNVTLFSYSPFWLRHGLSVQSGLSEHK
jgi:hypothetical protein